MASSYTPPSGLTAAIHHVPFWTSPAMSNGTHTLIITQTAAQAGGIIFLDYIQYNTTSTSVGAYFIDDRDPRITYTPPWRQFGSDEDFQHTSQESTSPGDSFSFTFEGECYFFSSIPFSPRFRRNVDIILRGLDGIRRRTHEGFNRLGWRNTVSIHGAQ